MTVALLGRRGFWLVPVAALAVTLMRIQVGAEVNIRTHLRVDEILSGSLLALIWLHRDSAAARLPIAAMTRFAPLLALAWFAACHPAGGPMMYLRPYCAALLVGTTLFAPHAGLRDRLSAPWLGYIARISYSLYIWHVLSMIGWLHEGSKAMLYLVKRPISLALTFFVADLSTRTIEAWAIARGKGWVRR